MIVDGYARNLKSLEGDLWRELLWKFRRVFLDKLSNFNTIYRTRSLEQINLLGEKENVHEE
jgi:hypothetical protein